MSHRSASQRQPATAKAAQNTRQTPAQKGAPPRAGSSAAAKKSRQPQSLDRPLVRRRGFWLTVGTVAIAVVLAALALGPALAKGGLEAVGGANSEQAPWPADPAGLRTRLSAASLPALTAEGTVLHIHQHLDLYVHGHRLAIPATIGIDQAAGIISPIHTHDSTGVIHVESPTAGTFYLGQFFQVWGVTLNSNCVGTYCTGNGSELKMWVNGTEYPNDPGTLPLQEQQEIVLAYGTPDEMPSTIPSTYDWSGL